LGGSTIQQPTGDQYGFTRSMGGVATGGQKALADGWYLGGGITYENSSYINDYSTEKLDEDSISGAIALKKEEGPWLIGLVGGLGFNQGTSKRYIDLGSVDAIARADIDSQMAFARIRGSYQFSLSDDFYMTPRLDLDMIYAHQSGYRESGAGAANLIVDGSDQTMFAVTPAVEFGARVPFLEDMPARLFADAGVSFLSDDSWERTARLAGFSNMSRFTTSTPIADTVAQVSAGIDFQAIHGLQVKLEYDGSFADGYQSHVGSIRLGYRF
uniref:autotransporter outer membrane beta-barrel domain-containing protein n=1 Tax=Martelella sp. HB161492 TaxID=2720726 RepID=UPI0015900FB0